MVGGIVVIADSVRERLKMSVKTLASWSSTESTITQSFGTAGALLHASVLLDLHKRRLARLVGSLTTTHYKVPNCLWKQRQHNNCSSEAS